MLLYSLRRLVASLLVLLASSFCVYVLAASTSDPLAQFRQRQPMPSEAFFAQKREELDLNSALPVRYWHWLRDLIFHGDFGNTINGSPIKTDLVTRLGVTGRMIVLAMLLAVTLAIVTGVVGAVRRNKPSDVLTTILCYMLVSLPVFWFAVLLKEFLVIKINNAIGEQWLFTTFEESPGISLYGTSGEIWSDRLRHLILPTIALAALFFASWSRFQRASMLDVMGADYMRLARAKGLPYRRVLFRHGLRNALIPLTTVVALDVGGLIGGAVITETVFQWHGMGEYLFVNGLKQQDVNVIAGWLVVSATFVVLFNLFADLLYAVLDPRIRLG